MKSQFGRPLCRSGQASQIGYSSFKSAEARDALKGTAKEEFLG